MGIWADHKRAILAFSIGAVLQLQESTQKNFAGANAADGNMAEAIADALAGTFGGGGVPSQQFLFPPYCTSSNGTSGCAGFSCAGNVFAARRITNCTSGACALEVRTCG